MDRTGLGVIALGLCCVIDPTFAQNYVNVAQRKTYDHSSAYVPTNPTHNTANPASYAANGNTDGTYSSTNCIHTEPNDPNDWWQVDLGAVYALYNFKVWGRNQWIKHLYPFAITVDGQTCASVNSGSTRSVDVTCSSIKYGQVVRVTRTNNTDPLNLCEFQVFVCEDGWWGQQCNSLCNCVACDRSNGSCTGSPCTDGRWGANCEHQCSDNCVETTCDRDTGSCSACVSGWYGDQCESGCLATTCHNNQCDQQTGLCTACDGDFAGDYCTECVPGYYGTNCDTACRSFSCLNNQCDSTTGWCTQCPGNFQGDSCSDCAAGYYGDSCTQACLVSNAKCRDSQCDRTTGLCAACPAHYEGYDCSGCKAGYYGLNCNTTCRSPNCLNNRCDETTGWCTSCLGLYYGDTCSDGQDSDKESLIGPVVGSVVGVGVMLALVIIGVACWYRRSQGKSQRSEDAMTSISGPALAMAETSSSPPSAAAPQEIRVDVGVNDENYEKLQNYVYSNENL